MMRNIGLEKLYSVLLTGHNYSLFVASGPLSTKRIKCLIRLQAKMCYLCYEINNIISYHTIIVELRYNKDHCSDFIGETLVKVLPFCKKGKIKKKYI